MDPRASAQTERHANLQAEQRRELGPKCKVQEGRCVESRAGRPAQLHVDGSSGHTGVSSRGNGMQCSRQNNVRGSRRQGPRRCGPAYAALDEWACGSPGSLACEVPVHVCCAKLLLHNKPGAPTAGGGGECEQGQSRKRGARGTEMVGTILFSQDGVRCERTVCV